MPRQPGRVPPHRGTGKFLFMKGLRPIIQKFNFTTVSPREKTNRPWLKIKGISKVDHEK